MSRRLLTRELPYIATNKRPIVIRKPSPLMPEPAMDKYGYDKEKTAVIDDRIWFWKIVVK